MAIQIRRIPLIFIFNAPESIPGGFLATATQMGAQVLAQGLVPTALSLATPFTTAVPGLKTLSGTLANKIIIPMLVNPTSIAVQKNPKVNETLTKRGILNQYWQAMPDLVTFQGRAAGARAFFILNQLDQMMKTMEDGTRNQVTMVYKFGGVYNGYFLNFRMAGDGLQPGVFDYSFDFQFTDQKHFRLFLYALNPSILNQAINNPGQAVTETLKLSASELASTTGISLGSLPKI